MHTISSTALLEKYYTFGKNGFSEAELRYDRGENNSSRFLARIVSISERDIPVDKMYSYYSSLILKIAVRIVPNDCSRGMDHHIKHEPLFSENPSSLDFIEHFHSVLPDDRLKTFLPQRC